MKIKRKYKVSNLKKVLFEQNIFELIKNRYNRVMRERSSVILQVFLRIYVIFRIFFLCFTRLEVQCNATSNDFYVISYRVSY